MAAMLIQMSIQICQEIQEAPNRSVIPPHVIIVMAP